MPQRDLPTALTSRLRAVLGDRPATEAELRSLSEEADAWARTLRAQIDSSEEKVRRLDRMARHPALPDSREFGFDPAGNYVFSHAAVLWLVQRYGNWVSYKPPVEPETWPLWAAPVLLLGLGLWLARGRFRRGRG